MSNMVFVPLEALFGGMSISDHANASPDVNTQLAGILRYMSIDDAGDAGDAGDANDAGNADDADEDTYSSDDDTTADDYTNDYAPAPIPNNFIDSINRLLGGGRDDCRYDLTAPTGTNQSYEPLLITDEDYEDYNDIMDNLDGVMSREISPSGMIYGNFNALFKKYADNPIVKAILRDTYSGKPVQYASKDDFYDDTDDLLTDFKGMSYHKFNHICSCQRCVYTITNCITQILTKKYVPYRLPYLDAAFEEIFTYGSWQNDGILWNTTYDELICIMTLYYPGYGCSAVEINPGQLYVCIHAIPHYLKMDITPKIMSRISLYDITYNPLNLSRLITSYNELESIERNIGGFYVHNNDIDDTLPPLMPDIN